MMIFDFSNFYIYLTEIFVVLIVFWISNKRIQMKNFLNPYVVFLWFHIVFLYIGLFYDFLYKKGHIYISTATKIAIIYSLFFSLIGALLAQVFLRNIGIKYKRIEHFIVYEERTRHYLLTAYVIFLLGFLLSFYFCLKLGGFIWLMGNFENLRIEARKGIGYISVLSIASVTYASLYILLSKKSSVFIKIIIFFLSTFSLLSFGQRAPFLKWFLLLFLLFLVKNRISFRLKQLVFYGIIVYFFMVLLGVFRKGAEDIFATLFLRMLWRPFVNIYNLQIIFDNFPIKIGYLLGKGYLIDLVTILPGYSPNLGTWIKEHLGLFFEGGSITITYIGDAYVNFGIFALLLYPFIYGFILNSIYISMSRHVKISLKRFIFLSLIAMSLGPSINTGFMGPLLYNFLPIYFFYILHMFLSSLIRVRKFSCEILVVRY